MFVGLDMAIGLVLVFSLVSLMCSAVQEWIAAWFHLRGELLWTGIGRLVGATLKDKVVANQLVTGLAKSSSNKDKPSYLPADTFVAALLDSLGSSGGGTPTTAGAVRSLVQELPEESEGRAALLALVDSANNDIERVKANIAQWYDAAMDRVSGWYKRRTQWILVLIALVLVPAVGVDTLKIAQALYANPQLRASVVEIAKTAASQPTTPTNVGQVAQSPVQTLKQQRDLFVKASEDFVALQVPTATFSAYIENAKPSGDLHFLPVVGWLFATFGGWLVEHGLGFLITIMAASLGAPFWFDLLSRFVNLRASGIKPARKSTGS